MSEQKVRILDPKIAPIYAAEELVGALPVGAVDLVSKDEIAGWAKDNNCPGMPIEVHVYAYRRGSNSAIWGIAIIADGYRSDVGNHAYSFSHAHYRDLDCGEYDIVVNAIGKDANGNNSGWNVALPLSLAGSEIDKTKQTIKKQKFAGGQYEIFSQYLGIMWTEPNNYDLYQSAVRTFREGPVHCFYTRSESGGESVYVRSSPNGITGWSDSVRVITRGPSGTLDSSLIADGNVVVVPEGSDFRYWLHYTGYKEGDWNYVFQATTTKPQNFVKRGRTGNVSTPEPMLQPSKNSQQLTYGAGQPSVVYGPDKKWHIIFTDTSCESPPGNTVIHLQGDHPNSFFDLDPSTYFEHRITTPNQENTAEITYYPSLGCYALVKLYNDARIWVGSSIDDLHGEYGQLIYDKDNSSRSYIAEGGLLRGLYGHITDDANSTIAYYGAGRDTGDWSRYNTTDTAATRFYLYKRS